MWLENVIDQVREIKNLDKSNEAESVDCET